MKAKIKGILLIAVFILSTITLAIPFANAQTPAYSNVEFGDSVSDADDVGWAFDPLGVAHAEYRGYTAKLIYEAGGSDAFFYVDTVGSTLDIDDLGTTANIPMFDYRIADDVADVPSLVLRFNPSEGDGYIDFCIVLRLEWGHTQNEWTTTSTIDTNEYTTGFAWFTGETPAGNPMIGDPWSSVNVNEVIAQINAIDTSYGDWVLTSVKISAFTVLTAYVDNVEIDGFIYDLEPTGNVGDNVPFLGTSTTPGGLIEVYWDSVKTWDGTAGLLESDYAVGFDYSIDITVPEGIAGDHYVIVKDVEAPEILSGILIVEPEIVLDPTTALEGDTITVDGTGFAADVAIDIEFPAGGDTMTTIPDPVETNDLGWFSCTFDVPTGATTADVEATDTTNSAVAELTIGATIALEPAEGPSGTVVDISGIGFTDDDYVTVTFGGSDVYWEGVVVDDLLVDSLGIFSGQFIVPTKAVGEYTVTATDESATSGTSDFEVTGTTAITLTPTSGAPDSEVTIEGFNFTAMVGKVVTITFGGLLQDDTFVTDSDGHFEGTVIVPSLVAGTVPVIATDSNDLDAEKDFKVVFTTLAVSPSTGPTGTKVLVMGGGYTENADFNITMDSVLMIDGEGTLTGDGSIESSPATYVYVPTLPVGDYTITVMDEYGITGTTSFEVTKTTEIILTPEGGPVTYPITLEANYFTAADGTVITITLYNETAGERDYENVFLTTDITEATDFTSIETNATGSYEGTFDVPELALGEYTINATDANGLTVETTFSVVESYVEIHTLSTEYDPGDTVSFYVNSTFDFALTIDIDDPTGYPFTTIDLTGEVWEAVGDYYVIPYVAASFELPSDAEIGTWNWTANEESDEVANGTFTVGVEPEPDPDPEPITDITLSVGWNLVSLPLIPDDSSIETVLADVLTSVDTVWWYNASTWYSYNPAAPAEVNTLDELVDGEGYWFNMTEAAVLAVSGTEWPTDPFELPPEYPVVEGWNMIGFKSTVALTVDDYLQGVAWASVLGYSDGYESLSGSDMMIPGRGYWIAVSEPGTIYP